MLALLASTGACDAEARPPVTAASAPAPQADGRFAMSDVTTPPPPPPVRQIDRPNDAPPREPEKREVDKTLEASAASGDGAQSSTSAPQKNAQMLVYTARLTMAVYQVAPALDAIEDVAKSTGGYLSSRNDAQITIRIPRAAFEDALKKIESTGDVLHREISAEDVTDAYVDAEARLKNARAVRDRLQALLEKAAVKEAIEIQKELERVTQEIEVYEGKLKLMRDRVAFSTIVVDFQARGDAALTASPRLPFPWLGELGLPRLLDLQ